VQLEKRGVATATIVTSGFVNATEAHRRLLKYPQLPYFVVPHPIVSMSSEQIITCADAIADSIGQAVHRGDATNGA
jgi:hypothetical protein